MLRGKVETAFPYTETGYLTTDEIRRFKSLGFNCIDLQYFWDYYIDSNGQVFMDRVENVLDKIIQRCEAEGMQVILSHRTTWGEDPRQEVYTESWLWYWDGARNGIANVFDQNGNIFKSILWFLEQLVLRYDKYSCVIGYEIENDPFHNYNPNPDEVAQYYAAIPKLCQVVRSNSNKTIFITPIHRGYTGPNYDDSHAWMDSLPDAPVSNCMVSLDGYGLLDPNFTMAPRSGWASDPSALKRTLEGAVQYRTTYNIPLMIGEFGINSTVAETDDGQAYITALLNAFEELGITSWFYAMKLINIDHTIAAPEMLELLAERNQEIQLYLWWPVLLALTGLLATA